MAFFPLVFTATERTRRFSLAVTAWLGLIAGSVFLFLFNPASPANQFFPKCPFHTFTGLQCPGCGSTRALYQILHLHPGAAFRLNPLTVLMLPFIAYSFLGYTRSAITGRPQRRVFIRPIYMWAGLVLLIFFWIFRNTPWYPFVS